MNTETKQDILTHLESLINERIIDVVGTYCSDKWKNLTRRLVQEDPTTLATEIAEAMSKGVTAALSSDNQWPNSCNIPIRLNEVVLSADQVAIIINCCWYVNAAQFTQLLCERMWFPGWTYGWVLKQVRATGASTHSKNKFNGMSVADGLNFVIIRRDGSGVTTFNDGREVLTPALPVEEHSPEPVSRLGKPKEMYGQYMSAEDLEARIARKAYVVVLELNDHWVTSIRKHRAQPSELVIISLIDVHFHYSVGAEFHNYLSSVVRRSRSSDGRAISPIDGQTRSLT